MNESLSDLERDIEASRARLDQTIGRIQDRLTPRHLVDEMIGSARQTPLNGLYDSALNAVRRNPVSVLLIAAGVSMLLNRMAEGARASATSKPEPQTESPAGALPDVRAGRAAEVEAAIEPSDPTEVASRLGRSSTFGGTP